MTTQEARDRFAEEIEKLLDTIRARVHNEQVTLKDGDRIMALHRLKTHLATEFFIDQQSLQRLRTTLDILKEDENSALISGTVDAFQQKFAM